MAEYFITAKLILDTALHVGTGKGSEPTDSPVRRAGDGRLLIPGRAIGGSLRTLATRLAPRLGMEECQILVHRSKRQVDRSCACQVCQLFGDIHPVDRPDNIKQEEWTDSRASDLWVYDAWLAADQAIYTRDGVGIDRQTGAAVRNVKYDYEVIPAKAVFGLRLRLKSDNENSLQLLAVTLAEWQAGRGQLGGNVARGLGRFHLKEVTCRQTVLQNASDLIAYLSADDQASAGKIIEEQPAKWLNDARQRVIPLPGQEGGPPAATGFIQVNFRLAFTNLFLINDPLMSLVAGFDHAPLVEMLSDKNSRRPLLSGSSLRGVLRSHGEKIVRTLATDHWWKKDKATAADRFLRYCPACNALARSKEEPLASCDARLAGIISDNDETPAGALCLGCRLFGSQRRGSRLWVRDAPLVAGSLDETSWKAQDFLAIDRFTGGGLDTAKFDAAPLLKAQSEGQLLLHDPE
ncbi:MAG: RAMP superfamily CRISPR-associated protein, partial [Chloroflexi bacterium]|nr:RAMP superfamily CRISPR-associated protein [Chloroflexota bacterium]